MIEKKCFFLENLLLFLQRLQPLKAARALVHLSIKKATMDSSSFKTALKSCAVKESDPNTDQCMNDHPMTDLLDLAMESYVELNSVKEIVQDFIPHSKTKHHSPPGSRWLTSRQTMRLLNISRTTIKRYRKLNVIRFIIINGQFRYRLSDIQQISITQNEE